MQPERDARFYLYHFSLWPPLSSRTARVTATRLISICPVQVHPSNRRRITEYFYNFNSGLNVLLGKNIFYQKKDKIGILGKSVPTEAFISF